ncbi:MAG: hypothetical protein KH895_01160 [Haemophilus haemolyticus]|jgi:hypothetical protein|nr:hypothetical protein [Haemophilus haemolyticus]
MAKKVDEQLWVRVLELERALKEQEKQTKQRIDELGQQYNYHHNHLPALCFICAVIGTFCAFQFFR